MMKINNWEKWFSAKEKEDTINRIVEEAIEYGNKSYEQIGKSIVGILVDKKLLK